jgi:hypothetical protein
LTEAYGRPYALCHTQRIEAIVYENHQAFPHYLVTYRATPRPNPYGGALDPPLRQIDEAPQNSDIRVRNGQVQSFLSVAQERAAAAAAAEAARLQQARAAEKQRREREAAKAEAAAAVRETERLLSAGVAGGPAPGRSRGSAEGTRHGSGHRLRRRLDNPRGDGNSGSGSGSGSGCATPGKSQTVRFFHVDMIIVGIILKLRSHFSWDSTVSFIRTFNQNSAH